MKCYLVIILLTSLANGEWHVKNACKTFPDYFFKDISPNCYYEPDVYSTTPNIIMRHTGVFEEYNITTSDGYILSIFRIPREKPKDVVILQHPVSVDSFIWVGQSNDSLAFYLWNAGYDVWLPNSRGTPYSSTHIRWNFSDKEYWDYSFHEIALNEYPAVIDFVKKKTRKSKVVIVGHSMSSTTSFIYASMRPNEAKRSVKVFVHLSPLAYMKHILWPFKMLAKAIPLAQKLNQILKIYHTETHNSLGATVKRTVGVTIPFKFHFVLRKALEDGFTPKEFDPALINIVLSHLPIVYSYKIDYHYAQQVTSGRFQMYDYGKEKNEDTYGSEIPPEYPVENIIAPQYLIYSLDDYYSTVSDTEYLYNKLQNSAKIHGIEQISGLNHIDFHYGKHRVEKVYVKVLDLLNKIKTKK